MIAKYIGETRIVNHTTAYEIELRHGEEYDVKIEMIPGSTFLDLVVYRTTDIDDKDR